MKKNNIGELLFIYFRTFYKVTGIRQGGTSIRVDAEGRIDQWNRIKSTQINPHIYSQLLFGKDAKSNQQDKKAFSTNRGATTGYTMQMNKTGLLLDAVYKN